MNNPKPDWLDWFGVRNLPDVRKARWLGGLLSMIGAVIVLGVFGLTFSEFFLALTGAGDFANAKEQSEAIRNIGLVLAAIVGVPFVVWRTAVAHKQADTAAQALFNDKINAASDDLHAMRQRWDDEVTQNVWEPDIVRRNAAIDRLEGLVRERPEEAPRVSRLLSVYVREMSREVPAEKMPEGVSSTEDVRSWAQALSVKRSDIENAAQTLGRLRTIDGVDQGEIVVDLRGSNLQAFDLSELDFTRANLERTYLEYAKLRDTSLDNAILFNARLQYASLTNARMFRSRLNSAILYGTNFLHADVRGALFLSVKLDNRTSLFFTSSLGAAFWSCNLATTLHRQEDISNTFGDATVSLRNFDQRPMHWSPEKLELMEFFQSMVSWQTEIGFDPDDPSTW